MSKFSPKDTIKITGFILATEFSRNGKVMEIALETDDFQQYIIMANHKGKELFDLIYCNVTVRGVLTGKDAHENKIIKIENYKINDHVHLINSGEKL